jgi:hypothetical protein
MVEASDITSSSSRTVVGVLGGMFFRVATSELDKRRMKREVRLLDFLSPRLALSASSELWSVKEGGDTRAAGPSCTLLMDERRLDMDRRWDKLLSLVWWTDGGREGDLIDGVGENRARLSVDLLEIEGRRSLIKSLTILSEDRRFFPVSSSDTEAFLSRDSLLS